MPKKKVFSKTSRMPDAEETEFDVSLPIYSKQNKYPKVNNHSVKEIAAKELKVLDNKKSDVSILGTKKKPKAVTTSWLLEAEENCNPLGLRCKRSSSYIELSSDEDTLKKSYKHSKSLKERKEREQDIDYVEKKDPCARDQMIAEVASMSFKVPKKRNSFIQSEPLDLDTFTRSELPGSFRTGNCPAGLFCDSTLPKTFSKRLDDALSDFKTKEDLFKQRKVNREAVQSARDRFCFLHKAEEKIIPEGIEKGYKEDIEYSKIPDRLQNHYQRFTDIILQKISSKFYKNFKNNNSGVKNIDINNSHCGYYGMAGMSWILKYLIETYKGAPNSPLTAKVVYPHSVIDFIQMVLVPEAALVLIAEDQCLSLNSNGVKTAKKILEDSADFGLALHNSNQDHLLLSASLPV